MWLYISETKLCVQSEPGSPGSSGGVKGFDQEKAQMMIQKLQHELQIREVSFVARFAC